MSDHIWDCHVNHYSGYYWQDLVVRSLDQYLTALGWDQSSWDNDGPTPESDDLYWEGLSAAQQHAAKQLCYSEDEWNEVPIPDRE